MSNELNDSGVLFKLIEKFNLVARLFSLFNFRLVKNSPVDATDDFECNNVARICVHVLDSFFLSAEFIYQGKSNQT